MSEHDLKPRHDHTDPLTLVTIAIDVDADTDRNVFHLDDLDGLCIHYRRAGHEQGFDFAVEAVRHDTDGTSFLVGRLVDHDEFSPHGALRHVALQPGDRICVY